MPDYDMEKHKCADFITTFEDPRLNVDSLHGKLKYMRLLQSVANRDTKLIEIEMDDIRDHFSS
jgi:hypothetical protein